MYKLGFGVQKDMVEAFKWFHVAADFGSSYAQFAIGMLL